MAFHRGSPSVLFNQRPCGPRQILPREKNSSRQEGIARLRHVQMLGHLKKSADLLAILRGRFRHAVQFSSRCSPMWAFVLAAPAPIIIVADIARGRFFVHLSVGAGFAVLVARPRRYAPVSDGAGFVIGTIGVWNLRACCSIALFPSPVGRSFAGPWQSRRDAGFRHGRPPRNVPRSPPDRRKRAHRRDRASMQTCFYIGRWPRRDGCLD